MLAVYHYFFILLCGMLRRAVNKMPLPTEFIEARELAKKTLTLASTGFRHMMDDAPPKSDDVNAFARIVESLTRAEKDFAIICERTAQVQ
jgi:hypothetical protein